MTVQLDVTHGIVLRRREGEEVATRDNRSVLVKAELEQVGVTQSWYGSRQDGAGLHLHRRHADSFYVLEGALTFRTATGSLHAPEGATFVAPPGVVHGFDNDVDAPVRFLNFHTPDRGFIESMRARQRVGYDATRYDSWDPEDGAPVGASLNLPGDGDRLGSGDRVATITIARDELALVVFDLQPGFEGPKAHVHRRHVEVAPADRLLRPPSVDDTPLLAHERDRLAIHLLWRAVHVHADDGGPRLVERSGTPCCQSSRGTNIARASGIRDHGATSTTWLTEPVPVLARTWRRPSRRRTSSSPPVAGSSSSWCPSCSVSSTSSSRSSTTGATSSASFGVSAALSRSASAVASRSVTVRRHEPPLTRRATSATFRTKRPARSGRASTASSTAPKARRSVSSFATASGNSSASTISAGGRRPWTRAALPPLARPQARRPSGPSRSATALPESPASCPSLRTPSASSSS